jgi:hypothetical protein
MLQRLRIHTLQGDIESRIYLVEAISDTAFYQKRIDQLVRGVFLGNTFKTQHVRKAC